MRRILLAFAVLSLLASGPAAVAQGGPSVRGSVTGSLAKSSTVSFRVSASHPDGWRTLKSITLILSLRGAPLEELVYEVDTTTLAAGPSTALLGTGDDITGRFFGVRALDVRVATAGDRLDLSFRARLLEDVPSGARFEFVAEDDAGLEARMARVAAVPEEDGSFPWTTVIVAAVVALLAGGFLGSRLAPHRRTSGRSIYQDVARKILEDRERGTSSGAGR